MCVINVCERVTAGARERGCVCVERERRREVRIVVLLSFDV